MKIPTLINRGRNGFNMTPMIDVVFLLIIFFLVASHLSDQETQIEMDLPAAESSVTPEASPESRITLNVPQENEILYSGKPVTLDQLGQLVQQARADHGDDVEIRIRTDKNVPYVSIAPILKSCADEGIWNVTFAVYRKEGKS